MESVRVFRPYSKWDSLTSTVLDTLAIKSISKPKLPKELHYQCRHSTCHKCSPENISDRNKPWPVFHKHMIREIVRTIGKEPKYCTTKSYFREWRISSDGWYDDEIQHTKNIDNIKEKCWRNSHCARGQMWEILCVPFGTKECNPYSIYGQKKNQRWNKNKYQFHHKKRIKKNSDT